MRGGFSRSRSKKKKKEKNGTIDPRRRFLLLLPPFIDQSHLGRALPDPLVARSGGTVERVHAHGLGLAVEELVHALLERAHPGDHDRDEDERERGLAGHFLFVLFFFLVVGGARGREKSEQCG